MSKPMHEPTFLVLTSLLSGPRHGYAILGDVEHMAEVKLRIGTLYAALDRLADEQLVEISAEEVISGRLRRSYRLTSAGEAAIVAETARMERLAREARSRLRARPTLSPQGLAP